MGGDMTDAIRTSERENMKRRRRCFVCLNDALAYLGPLEHIDSDHREAAEHIRRAVALLEDDD